MYLKPKATSTLRPRYTPVISWSPATKRCVSIWGWTFLTP